MLPTNANALKPYSHIADASRASMSRVYYPIRYNNFPNPLFVRCREVRRQDRFVRRKYLTCVGVSYCVSFFLLVWLFASFQSEHFGRLRWRADGLVETAHVHKWPWYEIRKSRVVIEGHASTPIFSKFITIGVRAENTKLFTFSNFAQFLRRRQLLGAYIFNVSRLRRDIDAASAKIHTSKLAIYNYESRNFWRVKFSSRTRQASSRERRYEVMGGGFAAIEKVNSNVNNPAPACVVDHFSKFVVWPASRVYIRAQIFNGIFMGKHIRVNGFNDLLFCLAGVIASGSKWAIAANAVTRCQNTWPNQ